MLYGLRVREPPLLRAAAPCNDSRNIYVKSYYKGAVADIAPPKKPRFAPRKGVANLGFCCKFNLR